MSRNIIFLKPSCHYLVVWFKIVRAYTLWSSEIAGLNFTDLVQLSGLAYRLVPGHEFQFFLLVPAYRFFATVTTGGNRTMVAAATIVIMAPVDGERISISPLVCPDKARCVSFSAPDIKSGKGRSHAITVDVAVDPSFLVIWCRKYSPSRWLQQMVTMVATADVPGGMTRVARQFWRNLALFR